jgi:DNA-directed RNA polymerase specialized sigma24 family protein
MEQRGGVSPSGRDPEAPAVQPRAHATPVDWDDVTVDETDLAGFADRTAAKRLQRLLADQEIVLRLSVEGFDGPTWQKVAAALAEYGWAVMDAWVITGHVFVECRKKGLGGDELTAPTGGIPRDEALELARDTVADALVNFRDQVLKQGKWNPAKGASLSTYFVGNCLLRFVNHYRSWRTRRGRLLRTIECDADRQDDRRASPEVVVVGRLMGEQRAAEMLAPIDDPTNREILDLAGQGYGVDEIAELTGLGYKQVESRLYRSRRTLRDGLEGAAGA